MLVPDQLQRLMPRAVAIEVMSWLFYLPFEEGKLVPIGVTLTRGFEWAQGLPRNSNVIMDIRNAWSMRPRS